jgi:hypothetical protein
MIPQNFRRYSAYHGARTKGTRAVEDVLEHHGVKGQKWGVRRKATVGAQEVVISDKRKKLKTSGGKGHPAHSDATSARVSGQIAKKSGHKALSNQQLQAYNTRLNLEQQAKRLSFNDASPPKKFALKLLGQTGKQQASEAANAVAAKQVKRALAAAALA